MRLAELPELSLTDAITRHSDRVTLSWLGQAGWVIRSAQATVVIDPYLSDSLARKYAGKVYPHRRMHPAPIASDALSAVDVVLCSHRHTDHMDAETLTAIAAASPDAVFVVPEAWAEHAADLGLPKDRILGAEEGRRAEVAGVVIDPVLAAHESIERDEAGHSLFLGYVVEVGGVRVYHSGDCVPYEGQEAAVGALRPDIAILPVNGRDTERTQRGVPGNFHPEEAAVLAQLVGARVFVASHFGLFDFNTVDQARLDAAVAAQDPGAAFVQPVAGRTYEVTDS